MINPCPLYVTHDEKREHTVLLYTCGIVVTSDLIRTGDTQVRTLVFCRPDCQHEYLLAFSCCDRWFCPSLHTNNYIARTISMTLSNKRNSVCSMLTSIEQYIPAASLGLLFVLSTGYMFINARNDNMTGNIMLLILLSIGIPRFFIRSKSGVSLNSKVFLCLWGYLVFGLGSVFFPPTEYAHLGWFLQSFFRLILMILLVQIAWVKNEFDQGMLRWLFPLLCLILGAAILLTTNDFLGKKIFAVLTPWPVVEFEWNNKIFSFHLLFLMWAAVACLWRRSRFETVLSLFLFVVTACALFSSTSESSQLAYICGVIIFGLAHLPVKRGRYWFFLTIFMLFLLLAVLWVAFAPVMPEDPMAVYNDKGSFLSQHWPLGIRLFLYDFCADLVGKNFLLGYGFGSTLSIPLAKGVVPHLMVGGHIAGGHPHNIVFLILIDHGILGFLWLSSIFFVFFDYLYNATLNNKAGPAIWALVMSGQVIFSLSFSIWSSDVVLTYALFFAFIVVITRCNSYTGTTVWRERVFSLAHGLVLLSFICYVGNSYMG